MKCAVLVHPSKKPQRTKIPFTYLLNAALYKNVLINFSEQTAAPQSHSHTIHLISTNNKTLFFFLFTPYSSPIVHIARLRSTSLSRRAHSHRSDSRAQCALRQGVRNAGLVCWITAPCVHHEMEFQCFNAV